MVVAFAVIGARLEVATNVVPITLSEVQHVVGNNLKRHVPLVSWVRIIAKILHQKIDVLHSSLDCKGLKALKIAKHGVPRGRLPDHLWQEKLTTGSVPFRATPDHESKRHVSILRVRNVNVLELDLCIGPQIVRRHPRCIAVVGTHPYQAVWIRGKGGEVTVAPEPFLVDQHSIGCFDHRRIVDAHDSDKDFLLRHQGLVVAVIRVSLIRDPHLQQIRSIEVLRTAVAQEELLQSSLKEFLSCANVDCCCVDHASNLRYARFHLPSVLDTRCGAVGEEHQLIHLEILASRRRDE
mmetsp:Transcript_12362/g.24601  ORF Transcript_12362/g.24601 Transcript_12362/m.24601 type:complete len:294 (+) Transcript_12362:1207-2088(+)